MSSRKEQMMHLLQECGEDCDCGCSAPLEPKDKKKKSKEIDESTIDRLLKALAEARKMIGVRQFRHIKKIAKVKSGRGQKIKQVRKMPHPVRKGPQHNRHR